MHRHYYLSIPVIFFSAFFCIAISCKNNTASAGKKTENPGSANEKIKTVFHKPGSSVEDTLTIRTPAAVFYGPDSLQLEKIKQQTDPAALASSEHEYFYMMRNARMVIKKAWPYLKIMDCNHYRYILFIKKDSSGECIDLDKYDDIDGLFVFNGIKPPVPVDAMNVATQVSFYLKP